MPLRKYQSLSSLFVMLAPRWLMMVIIFRSLHCHNATEGMSSDIWCSLTRPEFLMEHRVIVYDSALFCLITRGLTLKLLHNVTNLWKFGLNWSSICYVQENNERKNTFVAQYVRFQIHNNWLHLEVLYFLSGKFPNQVTLEGVVSHNVFYYRQLLVTK